MLDRDRMAESVRFGLVKGQGEPGSPWSVAGVCSLCPQATCVGTVPGTHSCSVPSRPRCREGGGHLAGRPRHVLFAEFGMSWDVGLDSPGRCWCHRLHVLAGSLSFARQAPSRSQPVRLVAPSTGSQEHCIWELGAPPGGGRRAWTCSVLVLGTAFPS